jgi:hypothetical protein
MKTITITWKAFCHEDTPSRQATSATIQYDAPPVDDIILCEKVFRDTNLYEGDLWDILEPVLPDNGKRTHTALSVGDTVEVDGNLYLCDHIGWELLSTNTQLINQ